MAHTSAKNLDLNDDHDEGLLHPLEPFKAAKGKVVMDLKQHMIRITTPVDLSVFPDHFGAFVPSVFCFDDNREVRWLPGNNVVLTPFGRTTTSHSAAETGITYVPTRPGWIPRFSRAGLRKSRRLFWLLSFLADIRRSNSTVV